MLAEAPVLLHRVLTELAMVASRVSASEGHKWVNNLSKIHFLLLGSMACDTIPGQDQPGKFTENSWSHSMSQQGTFH